MLILNDSDQGRFGYIHDPKEIATREQLIVMALNQQIPSDSLEPCNITNSNTSHICSLTPVLNGRWVEAPGEALLKKLKKVFKNLPWSLKTLASSRSLRIRAL